MKLLVGARASPLSKAQVKEVHRLIHTYHPHIIFEPLFVNTTGDIDKHTSLRDLGKTDFFTRELDDMLINGKFRIAVHSAKDLPEPIPEGLVIAALTEGLDPSDSLVLRNGETLKDGAIVATSSERREAAVRQIRSNVTFVDIRGTIGERLDKLKTNEVDGVVIAEAALIRLGMITLNRIKLPGETVPFQGQLAILVRKNDVEMIKLFSCLDCR